MSDETSPKKAQTPQQDWLGGLAPPYWTIQLDSNGWFLALSVDEQYYCEIPPDACIRPHSYYLYSRTRQSRSIGLFFKHVKELMS